MFDFGLTELLALLWPNVAICMDLSGHAMGVNFGALLESFLNLAVKLGAKKINIKGKTPAARPSMNTLNG